MTTRLILVRHGRSRHQDENVAGGPKGDTSITEWVTEHDTTAGGPADNWTFADWDLVRCNDTGHLED